MKTVIKNEKKSGSSLNGFELTVEVGRLIEIEIAIILKIEIDTIMPKFEFFISRIRILDIRHSAVILDIRNSDLSFQKFEF
jgi:hypothetical protein